jgi:hypothetical protein
MFTVIAFLVGLKFAFNHLPVVLLIGAVLDAFWMIPLFLSL